MDYNTSGYNKEKVEDLEDVIQETYDGLVETIAEKIETQLVKPMSTKWYAPEAEEEFKEIKKAFETMGENMQQAYQAYRDWIQGMGVTWAENTHGAPPDLGSITKREISVDVSDIKDEDSDGNIILDENGAKAVASSMRSLYNDIKQLIYVRHSEMNASAAFLGHGQATAARSCFERVGESAAKLFELLITLEDRLNQYAEKYKQVAEDIRSNLDKLNVEVSN